MDMAQGEIFEFYTFRRAELEEDSNWLKDDIGYDFFASPDEATNAVVELQNETMHEFAWTPMQILKVHTEPVTADNLLALLNGSAANFIGKWEVVGIVP